LTQHIYVGDWGLVVKSAGVRGQESRANVGDNLAHSLAWYSWC
jgi:hypothetical protein